MTEYDRLLRSALAYASRIGWPVFPCYSVIDGKCGCGDPDCRNEGKHPLTANGFKGATRDEGQIRIWWGEHHDANIGIPTGAISDLDVLDVDPRNGGEQSLEELESELGALPDTVEQQTGGGGRHILFRHAEGVSCKVDLRPGLDIRGDGGYIIVAPSLHVRGDEYTWEDSSRPGQVETADWPAGLLALTRPTNGKPKGNAPRVEGSISEGRRNDQLASLAGSMLYRGCTPTVVLTALKVVNTEICDPPLPDAEVTSISRSIARYEANSPGANGSTGGEEGADSEDDPGPQPVEEVDKFPTEALAGPLKALVEEGAQAIQCAPELIAIPLLAAIGAATGASTSIRLKAGWEELPALYAVSVAVPGDAKTPAQRLACKHVHERQANMAQEYEEAKAKFQSVDLETTVPTMIRVVTADATVEGLVPILRDNPRGLLIDRDELSGLVQAMNAYKAGKGADRQFYLSMWSGAPFTVDRKSQGEPLFLRRPFLAITGTIQPDCVRSMLHESAWNDGFMDRFLFAYPEPRPVQEWTEKVVTGEIATKVDSVFKGLYGIEMTSPRVAAFEPDAKELWIKWYNQNQAELKEVPDPLRGPWAKMPNQCARLILICHMARWAADEVSDDLAIDSKSVAQGTRLTEYFKSHVRRVMNVLGESEEERIIRRVVDWMKRRGNPGVLAGDVVASKIVKTAKQAREVLDSIRQRGMGDWDEGGKRFSLTERSAVSRSA